MLTIFSTPKPFRGHSNIIQRNAIRSWTLLHPDVEVILVGDDEGTAEVCQEFRLRHVPQVERTALGTKYLPSIFDGAQEVARHNVLCYVNCDIMLTSDFRAAVEQVAKAHERFLMVGRRWDTSITEPWDFARSDWEQRLRECARAENFQRPSIWIDYFVFCRDLYYHSIPPFVIGRPGWDPWLIWFAGDSGAVVVDASRVVTAVHQNHDYSYHPQGAKGVGTDEQARKNYKLVGGWRHVHTIDSARELLTEQGLRSHRLHWLVPHKQKIRGSVVKTWFSFLDLTRPLRHSLGIKTKPKPAMPNPR